MSMPWSRWPLLLASLVAGPSLAAGDKPAPISSSTILQVRAREPSRVAESLSQLNAQRPVLGLSARDEFRPLSVQTDEFGLTHTHFQQYHQGIPVWGGMAITHLDRNGRGLAATKEHVRPQVRVSTHPVVDGASAAALALLEVRPLGLPTQRPTTDLVIYPETKKVLLAKGKRPTQLNAEDVREELVRYRLAWHVHTVLDNASDGVKHTDFLLDAHTGEVLQRWNSLETAAAVGTGLSQYSGQVRLDVFQNARGQYELRDTTRASGEGLRTYDVNHANVQNGEPATLTLYEDADNVWGDGANHEPDAETTSANGQTAAVDAHFGLQATWDYYQKIHGRFGIDNAGTPTFNRVHVSTAYDNAFWSNDCFCMSYGDGSLPWNSNGFRSVVALDVVAHELSHGVMHQTAALIYKGESGGLNEASSDIFGTLTEFWVRNGQGNRIGDTGGNWLLGEDLSSTPLRYMYKPSLDGYSRNAWSATLDSLDVHYSSGPMNRAFYFLSQGAQSTAAGNDYSSAYLPDGMTGIGNDKAAAIWYRALTVYLTPSSNYVAARTASLLSAADLYGTQSAEYRAVRNAFAAINVGYSASTYDDLTPPKVSVTVSGIAPALSFSAVATDNKSVARVEYFVDNVLAGSSALQPYTVALDNSLAGSGTHQVVARAYDLAGNTGVSAPATFTVDNGFTQLLRNAGFEQGKLGWVEGPLPNISYPATGARTGQGYVWLNGYGMAVVDSVYQQVSIPTNAQSATLSFYLNIQTQHIGSTVEDTLVAQVRDTNGQVLKTLATWSNQEASSAWVQRSFDLSEFAGRTVRLFFEGTEKNDSRPTSFQLDDFSLRVITTPDTKAPLVTASAQVTNAQALLLAQVWDDGFVGAVEWLVDNQSQGTSTTSFEKTLQATALGAGYHTLVVRATDKAGHAGTSSQVTFLIDDSASSIVLNPSFEQYTTAYAPLNWTFTTTDSSSNGVLAGEYGSGYAHSGMALMYFSNYNWSATSSLTQTVTIPANAQSIYFKFWLWVESNWTLNTNLLTVSVKDTRGTVLRTLGSFSEKDTSLDHKQYAYDLSAFKGQTIQLAFDAKTKTTYSSTFTTSFNLDDVTLSTTLTPDTLPPTLAVGVIGTSGTVQLYTGVTDNVKTTMVNLFVDGTPVATLGNPPGESRTPYGTSALINGPHEFKATAKDAAGNETTKTVIFNVYKENDVTAPTVSAAVEGAFATTVFTATATDDTGVTFVEFYVDGVFQGRVQTAPYRLPFSTLPLTPGEHTLTAVAHDAHGHTGTATVAFTRADPRLSRTRVIRRCQGPEGRVLPSGPGEAPR